VTKPILLGYEIGSGEPVEIPLRHMVVTGQTQEAGKTTTLEALIVRSGVKAVAFVTKRGEGSFSDARVVPPYFREQADWKYVASILEASRREKLKFERSWIIRASKGARSLADVHRNVRKALETAKGIHADVYLTLDAYLEDVVPQIEQVQWAKRVELSAGLNVMDLTKISEDMQHLVIRSTIEWVLNHESNTVVVVPEAWKFIPQGRGTPVKLAAEAYIRQAAGLGNYLWLDSQDIAGVEKMILKSVPVWILGVQRESNEIKRTLAQIPEGIVKPKPAEIATLRIGQFYSCHGSTTVKVYVQPAWMTDHQTAIGIAMGAKPPASPTKREDSVTEQEAIQLREQNTRLKDQNDELRRQLDRAERVAKLRIDEVGDLAVAPKREPIAADVVDARHENHSQNGRDGDDLYETFKRRMLAEEPAALLRVLQSKPELRIEVVRETITADGKSIRGRIGRMIAAGFWEGARTSAQVQAELEKRGAKPSNIELGNELKALTEMGFFTRENKWYSLVPGMAVNVVER
jgi:hypothetical protein